MRATDDVVLRTAEELLEGFGIPFEAEVLRTRAAAILHEFSLAIERRLRILPQCDSDTWLALCRDALADAYARQADGALHLYAVSGAESATGV
jgi:hypothetical protein